MVYDARVIADSVSEAGARLTTLQVTFPRFVLAEFNTHRMLSRNSASSRAIPVKKQLERVDLDPFIPIHWGAAQKGMQAENEISKEDQEKAVQIWLSARDSAVDHVLQLLDLGIHKQIANRLLEPYMFHPVLVTATGDAWPNFFALRDHPDAQPEIQKAAALMRAALSHSKPKLICEGEWHLPLIGYVPPRSDFVNDWAYAERKVQAVEELEWASQNPVLARKVSAGRAGRVSYLTHDGFRDYDKDIELYESLASRGHMSPLEHVATPYHHEDKATHALEKLPSGNFLGWMQLRKTIEDEDDFSKVLARLATT